MDTNEKTVLVTCAAFVPLLFLLALATPWAAPSSEDLSSPLKYRIISEVRSARLPDGVILGTVVDVIDVPPARRLKSTAMEIWKNHGGGDELFTVRVFLPDMNTKGKAYAVARFSRDGLVSFVIQEDALMETDCLSCKR